MATGWKSAITFLSHFTSHLDAVPLPGAQYLEGVCHLQQVQVYCDGKEVVQDFINSNYDQEELQIILIAVSDSRKRRSRKCTKKSLKNYQKYQGPVI